MDPCGPLRLNALHWRMTEPLPTRKPVRLRHVAVNLHSAPLPAAQPIAPRKRRGSYILPNLFTTGNLFCGFFAIVQAMNGRFEQSAMAIFFAMILDGLDGRVARMTNTQSAFGEQYDSLADMVSFGTAPALVIYEFALKGMGKLGWLAAFIYVAGAALRLARFNTNIKVVDKRFFQGLASPAAAALVSGFIWLIVDNRPFFNFSESTTSWLAWAFTVYAGLTMVSNAPFYSGKDINLKQAVPFTVPLVIVMIFVGVAYDPPSALFAAFLLYAFSGWVLLLWRKFR
jgi:CDP-diacylglycerol---serine O-phosphatidyltransferase